MKYFLPVRCIGLILPAGSPRTQSSCTFVVAVSTLKPASDRAILSIGGDLAAVAAPVAPENSIVNDSAASTLNSIDRRELSRRFMGFVPVTVVRRAILRCRHVRRPTYRK